MGKGRSKETPEEKAAREAEEARERGVEVSFLEAVRRRLPGHGAVIESLGCLYTEMGRYAEGLEADRAMVRLEPHSALAWYNLACSLSLTGGADDAFAALAKAAALGYADAEWMKQDDDFAPIRSDPRFARILAQIAAKQKKG